MLADVFDRVEEKALQRGIQEGIQRGIQKGRQEGRQEGIQKGRKEVAKKMLSKGVDLETIVEVTGLKKTEILQLKRKKKKSLRGKTV